MTRGNEIDAELMDFLYGELSAADADRFRERMAGDAELTAEVEALQRTREAFKALPLEEPPPAVSAQVLHEAAKRAPARKRVHTVDDRPGLWATMVEFFQPLVRHPAAASIAALLLVGGVAGALYLRGVDSPAHPNVASEAPAPGLLAAGRAPTDLSVMDGKDVAFEDGAFARIDGLSLDGAEGDLTLKSQPAAGYLATGAEDGEGNSEYRARLAQPEQEKALRDSTGESQRWSMNKKSDKGRRGGSTTRGVGEPLANAVSGADPLIVPEEAFKAVPKPVVTEDRSKDSDDKALLSRDARDSTTTIGGLAGKKGKRELSERESEEKSVARQAPLRKSKEIAAPAKKPAPGSRSFADDDGYADDFGVADEEADVRAEAPQSARPPPTVGTTSSVSGGGGGSYRAYKNRRDDDRWAMSEQGKLNRVLDKLDKKVSKKSKNKFCREAARIANDILDRTPEYYTSKVKRSKWLQRCSGFVAFERTRRAKKRAGGTPGKANAAKKRSKKSGGKPGKANADKASEMDAAESVE